MQQRHPITPQGRETRGIAISRIHARRLIDAASVVDNLLPTGNIPETERQARELAPRIGVGDSVRIFDGFYGQYFWHETIEIITGAHPQIKVDAYDCFISASLVNGHRKGRK
jgi:hypothetical protein